MVHQRLHNIHIPDTIAASKRPGWIEQHTSPGIRSGLRWPLGQCAVAEMRMTICVSRPGCVFKRRSTLPLDQCSLLELVTFLGDEGWRHEEVPCGKRLEPVLPSKASDAGMLVWYTSKNKPVPFRGYLLALATIGLIFDKQKEAGCSCEVHHMQKYAYYLALLAATQSDIAQVRPNLPAKQYHKITQGSCIANPEDLE